MDGGFKAVCDRLATGNKITIKEPEDPNVVEIPFDLESDITALVDMIKPKMNRLDRVHIGFVEHIFDDLNQVNQILKEHYDMNIDDGVSYALSRYLYDKSFNDLDADEQSIIKVLAVYICVQKFI
jgi:hypothetical protein